MSLTGRKIYGKYIFLFEIFIFSFMHEILMVDVRGMRALIVSNVHFILFNVMYVSGRVYYGICTIIFKRINIDIILYSI